MIYIAPAALLYAIGGRGYRRETPWRELAFACGLLSIVVALYSPLDYYADQLFWVHMLQHVILLTVAPPLILLGRPWPRMWRALPLRARARVGRELAQASWSRPLRILVRPLAAWLLFNASVVAWHIPAAYNATLANQAVHDCEHAVFFFTGLLFWAHVINPGPLRHRIDWLRRAAYLVGAMIVGWALAITLALSSHPLYTHYADLASRPGGISALSDQQIAAGVMWVPGSISYAVAVFFCIWRWLEPERPLDRTAIAA